MQTLNTLSGACVRGPGLQSPACHGKLCLGRLCLWREGKGKTKTKMNLKPFPLGRKGYHKPHSIHSTDNRPSANCLIPGSQQTQTALREWDRQTVNKAAWEGILEMVAWWLRAEDSCNSHANSGQTVGQGQVVASWAEGAVCELRLRGGN